MTESQREPLRTLLETIASQLAEIEAQLRALYDDAFVKTGSSSVRFGDGLSGARLPAGAENASADYSAGGGDSGNEPVDPTVALLDRFAQLDDVLTEAADRIAEEAYVSSARTRRSRLARLIGLVVGVLVGIAIWQVCRCKR